MFKSERLKITKKEEFDGILILVSLNCVDQLFIKLVKYIIS